MRSVQDRKSRTIIAGGDANGVGSYFGNYPKILAEAVLTGLYGGWDAISTKGVKRVESLEICADATTDRNVGLTVRFNFALLF